MKLHLTEDKTSGPWVETFDVVNGYHMELIEHIPRLGLNKSRAGRLSVAALIRAVGGDWGQLDTETPAPLPLTQYRSGEISAEQYLRSREGLAMDLPNASVAELEAILKPLVSVSKGEAKPSGAQS